MELLGDSAFRLLQGLKRRSRSGRNERWLRWRLAKAMKRARMTSRTPVSVAAAPVRVEVKDNGTVEAIVIDRPRIG